MFLRKVIISYFENDELTTKKESVFETSVEMEALTDVTIAALMIYDMCKAISQKMKILNVRLMEKTGGKSDIKN